jgi:hypothetical protein
MGTSGAISGHNGQMDNGNGGIGQMRIEGTQVNLMPGFDAEVPDPGWPGVFNLHLSRPVPVGADDPDGVCAVVVTAEIRTAWEAEVFRDAVLKLARTGRDT